MSNFCDVVEPYGESFAMEVQDKVLDGWSIVEGTYHSQLGLVQSITMKRDEKTVEAFRQASVGIKEKPKLTRAESLELARSVRSANKAAKLTDEIVQ